MSTTEPVLAECLVSAALIFCVWYFGFRRMKNDSFRCEIRQLRDELFDFMVVNGLDFRDEAYLKTREFLNGILRLSNILDPIVFVIIVVVSRNGSRGQLGRVTARAPEALQQKLKETQKLAVERFVAHICSGFIGFVVLTSVSMTLRIRSIWLKIAGPRLKPKSWVESKTERIVPEFISVGSEQPSTLWRKLIPDSQKQPIHAA